MFRRKQGQCFRCCPFVYVIMLVSKLRTSTNTELYCSSVRFFCLDTVRYSRKQSSIITEQAESDRVSVYRQSHRTARNSRRETYNGCIIVQKIPLKILSGYIVVRI